MENTKIRTVLKEAKFDTNQLEDLENVNLSSLDFDFDGHANKP